jgi:Mg-chelatase subunit ChlI
MAESVAGREVCAQGTVDGLSADVVVLKDLLENENGDQHVKSDGGAQACQREETVQIRRRDTVQKRGHGEDYAGDPNSLTFTYSVKSTEDSSCCQKASNAAAGSTDLGPGRQQQLHDHDREQIRESSLSAVKGLSQ